MRRVLVGVLATLALATACGPAPVTPAATPAAAPSSASPTTRPQEVEFDTGQPCALLEAEQLAEFEIDGEGTPIPIKTYETTGCSWTAADASYRLIPVTTEGIEAWTGGERAARTAATEPVLGFPAIEVTSPADTASCDVMVDTAAGQYLVASFTSDAPEPCDGARRLAGAALRNLVG